MPRTEGDILWDTHVRIDHAISIFIFLSILIKLLLSECFICIIVYCYLGVYLFVSISLIPQILDVVLPLNESRPILPTYPGHYFVDERKYFFYIFSHSIITWEIVTTVVVSHDCMLLTYIEHVCSIFALVG